MLAVEPKSYKPVIDKKNLIIGTGREIIITGWTPKEKVYNKLKDLELDFAVIGNLYSPMLGLEGIFINLLANPYDWSISTLEELRQDLISPGVAALHEFFKRNYYIDKDRYVITNDSRDIVGGFDANVFKPEHLNWLIETYSNINRYYRCIDLIQGLKQRAEIKTPLKRLQEPVFIEIKRIERKTIPGRPISHQVIESTINEAYVKALYLVMNHGKEDNNKAAVRKEILCLTSCITNDPGFVSDSSKDTNNDGLSQYIDTVINAQVKLTDSEVSYVYGDRIRNYKGLDQIEKTCNLLIENPLSTRLYIDLWQVEKDLGADNPPCLTNVWLRLIDNQLILTATFRSHDIFNAYKPNLIALRSLQDLIVNKVNEKRDSKIQPGAIFISSLSAHVYSNCYDLANQELSKAQKTPKSYDDPVGNFIIKWESGIGPLVVEQIAPKGSLVKLYIGHTVTKIVTDILDTNPSIDKYHLAYLVQELMKADSYKDSYIQDIC